VLGLPGAVVPANGMELRKSAIRGVESNGMMCSTRELAWARPRRHHRTARRRALGTFADYIGSDPVFDVAITPNRPDCMGVYGIARDLAAAGIGTLRALGVAPVAGKARARSPSASRTPKAARPLRPRDQGCAERPLAAMAARPAQGRWPAPDLGAGGHHQLCDARLWPPGPCL
jgi:hypothetical protein